MPSIKHRPAPSRKPRRDRNDFSCRICKGRHALRDCQKFLNADVNGKMRLILLHGYCPNCLAHEHSTGTCFSTRGCRHCGGSHHSLLHIKEETLSDRTKSKIGQRKHKNKAYQRPIICGKESNSSTINITSITALHCSSLFPTAVIVIKQGRNQHHARAVIDSCSSVSKISKNLVYELNLPTTKLGDETICSITIQSRHSTNTIIETTMKVNNKLSMHTPTKSINSSIAAKFSHISLADPEFYKSRPFAIVLGADLYTKIITAGQIPSHDGLPVAINTVFGWVLAGSCST